MKWVVSRYNHKIAWLQDYTDEVILYDRSEIPIMIEKGITYIVANLGSDIADKLTWIIDNYDNLPETVMLIKANLFDYIRPKEFELIKDNKIFTPILTQTHKEVFCDDKMPEPGKPFAYYKDGMYYELNWPAYLKKNPCRNQPDPITLEWYFDLPLVKLLGLDKMEYIPFAPGSNYLLPKENILKHPKEFYEKLKSYIDWAIYPGECMILERGLYSIWK